MVRRGEVGYGRLQVGKRSLQNQDLQRFHVLVEAAMAAGRC